MKSPISSRIQPICNPTIWQKVVSLVQQTKGVNLSQGAPEFGPQPFFIWNMQKAAEQNVYEQCDTKGIPMLRKTVADYHERQYGKLNPDKNIVITNGASVALYCLFMTFIDPGDEVLMFEPTFDFYRHYATIFGAKSQNVKLINNNKVSIFVISKKTRQEIKQMIEKNEIKSQNWDVDWAALESKLSQKVKILILNSPQNPTGKIFTQQEIDRICQLALKYPNLVIIQDNVYEGFMFDQFKGKNLPKVIHSKYYNELRDRVLNVYSAGKLLQATGIRCGWIIGPEVIIDKIHHFHNKIIESVSYLVQKATALSLDDIRKEKYHYLQLEATRSEHHRQELLRTLSQSKYDWKISVPQSGYFIIVDISQIEIKQKYFYFRLDEGKIINPRDLAFCYQMAFQEGVVIVPCSSFFSQENKEENLIRFALCKNLNAIKTARQKLQDLSTKI